MILILTCKEDSSADFVIKKLTLRQLAYKRINLDEVRKMGFFSFRPMEKNNWSLSDGCTEISLDQIGAVWQRRVPRRPIKHDNQLISDYLTQEWKLCWEWWLNQLPVAKVLDSASSLRLAGNKMLQLKRAKDMGFNIPDTLITSSPDEFELFRQRHESVIAKSLAVSARSLSRENHLGLSYTSLLAKNMAPESSSIRAVPMILQEEIKKESNCG